MKEGWLGTLSSLPVNSILPTFDRFPSNIILKRIENNTHIPRKLFSQDAQNKNAQTKQKQETNGNRAIWLVYRTDTNARGFWLVKRTLGWKNFMPEELSRNQPILRFDVILQPDWPIEQCLLHIRVFFGGKTKRPCFDLFIHWLLKQITNTYRNHFSRSYENHSIETNSSSGVWQTPKCMSGSQMEHSSCLVY